MAYILIGGCNRPGVGAIASALELGHKVSLLITPGLKPVLADDEVQSILARIDVIELSSFMASDELTAIISDLNSQRPISAGFTVFEPAVLTFAEACELCGIKATAASAVRAARDKAACRQLLNQAGIPQIPFRRVANHVEAVEFAREVGYPIILKPNNGLASMLVATAHDDEDVRSYFDEAAGARARLPEMVVENIEFSNTILAEKYVRGELHSIEIAVADYATAPLVLSRRKRDSTNDFIELGSTMPGTQDAAITDRAFDYASRIITALGFDRGILHLEVIIDEFGMPHLVEVNPRLMGGTSPSLFNLVSGRNVFADLIRIHLDEPIDDLLPMTHAAASRVIGAAADWTVRSDLPQDWIAPLLPELSYHSVALTAGKVLPKMEHNFHSLGQIQVRAATPSEADKLANHMIERISAITGVPLCK